MKSSCVIIFLLYLVVGLYFINFPFDYVEIPDYVAGFNDWIIFVGGILVIFGGLNYLRAAHKKKH